MEPHRTGGDGVRRGTRALPIDRPGTTLGAGDVGGAADVMTQSRSRTKPRSYQTARGWRAACTRVLTAVSNSRGAALWAALALGCGLAACADSAHAPHAFQGGVSAPSSPVRRPEMRLVQGAMGAQPRIVATFDLGEPGSFAVDARQDEIVTYTGPDGGAPRKLRQLFGKEVKRVTLPLRAGLERFQRITIEAVNDTDAELAVGFHSKSGLRIVAHEMLGPTAALTTIVIDLDHPNPVEADALVLEFRRPGRPQLGRVHLVDLGIHGLLPSPPDPAGLFAIGEAARAAFALSTASPLETAFDVPSEAQLQFSYGMPEGMCASERRPVLVLHLTAPSGARLQRFPIAVDDVRGNRWHSTRVSLHDYDGERIQARFALEAEGPEPTACALGQPQVFHPEANAAAVLLVTSDTHRADHLGAARLGIDVQTPVLDRLAAEGALFEECFSSSNVTLPSHISIMTATSLRDTRLIDNHARLSETARTLAEAFAEAGYVTYAAVSASHLDERWSGLGQGFDRMSTCRVDKRSANETLKFLERWLPDAEGKPLFVWLHLFDAHMPYAAPTPFDRLYYPTNRNPFEGTGDAQDACSRFFDKRLSDPSYPIAQYKGEVSYLDSELGRLFAHDRFASGIVAFTADHGENLGEHGICFGHSELYTQSLHVPLIVKAPGVAPGSRSAARVLNLDVGRTLLDLAGLSATSFPGRDLLTAPRAPDEPVYTISAYGFSASVTAGRWHCILHLKRHFVDWESTIERSAHVIELYDLELDPKCGRDLADSAHDRALGLRANLIEWLARASTHQWAAEALVDAEVERHLTALGYSGDASSASSGAWFPAECACEPCSKYAQPR